MVLITRSQVYSPFLGCVINLRAVEYNKMKSDYKTYLQRRICYEFTSDDEAKQWLHDNLGYNINTASESQLLDALDIINGCPTIAQAEAAQTREGK